MPAWRLKATAQLKREADIWRKRETYYRGSSYLRVGVSDKLIREGLSKTEQKFEEETLPHHISRVNWYASNMHHDGMPERMAQTQKIRERILAGEKHVHGINPNFVFMTLWDAGQELLDPEEAKRVQEIGVRHGYAITVLPPGEKYKYDNPRSLPIENYTEPARIENEVPQDKVLVQFSGGGHYNSFWQEAYPKKWEQFLINRPAYLLNKSLSKYGNRPRPSF